MYFVILFTFFGVHVQQIGIFVIFMYPLLCIFSRIYLKKKIISREAMLVEMHKRIPFLSAWVESCYSCQLLLYLGEYTIHICCGVQHGDPLDPLGFALTLHPIAECIKTNKGPRTLSECLVS